MTQEPVNSTSNLKWILILVAVAAVAFVGFYVVRMMYQAFYSIIFCTMIALLIFERKLVMKLFNKIKGIYIKNKILGVITIIAATVAFVPFLGFLLIRTGWYFLKPRKKIEKITEVTEKEVVNSETK